MHDNGFDCVEHDVSFLLAAIMAKADDDDDDDGGKDMRYMYQALRSFLFT